VGLHCGDEVSLGELSASNLRRADLESQSCGQQNPVPKATPRCLVPLLEASLFPQPGKLQLPSPTSPSRNLDTM
jgi:hypothetical protein